MGAFWAEFSSLASSSDLTEGIGLRVVRKTMSGRRLVHAHILMAGGRSLMRSLTSLVLWTCLFQVPLVDRTHQHEVG